MLKIHHNTEKKARTHGITLVVMDNEIVATLHGQPAILLASGKQGTAVLDEAIARLTESKPAKTAKPTKKAAGESADHHAIKLQNELTKRAAKQKPARVEADDEPKTASVISARFREKYSEHGGVVRG
jgi:hypothetical protein